MNKIIYTTLVILVIAIISPGITQAAQWYVSTAGNNANTGTTSGNAWRDIQYAINNAGVVNGDVINVAAGTYNENQILITKSLSLLGAGADLTIIDGGSASIVTAGLVRITNSGNVTFNGFRLINTSYVPNANPNLHLYVGIYASSSVTGVKYVITNNKIYGTNNADKEEDYGFYTNSGKDTLVFQYNMITQTGANAVLIEKHSGPVDVSNNTLNAGVYGIDAIFNMTYGGLDITALHKFSNNAIDLSTGSGSGNASGVTIASSFSSAANGNGKFTNVQITGNTITGLKANRRGITLWNGAVGAGTAGDITNPVITKNTITGLGPTTLNCRGIQLINLVSNAVVTNNFVSLVNQCIRGFTFGPGTGIATGTQITDNSFTNFTELNWGGASVLDASGNWWGINTPSGFTGSIDYTPWLNTGTDILPGTPGFQGDFSNLWVDDDSPQTGVIGRIQEGIDLVSGSTVNVAAGTYEEGSPQIVINKNITIVGANKNTVIIKPSANTQPGGGDARAWILVNAGKTFNLSNVTLDGVGKLISIAVLSHGSGTINNNIIKNMGYNPSSDYLGRGIASYGPNMTISNNTLTNIGRIGIFLFGTNATNAVVTGNSYTGKGTGNWLDYGIEIGSGAIANVSNNTISNCKGVAASDGSYSAGSLISTYFGNGTTGNYTNNNFTNNYVGIHVGYAITDASIVTAHNNNFNGNTFGIKSTNPIVNGINNWWGNESGPKISTNPGGTGDSVSIYVTYNPWTGQSQSQNITNANLNVPVNFAQSNTSATFTSLPPATNAQLTIQRMTTPPAGVPAPPTSAGGNLGLYLNINATGLTNGTFQVTIVVDVSLITGFNAGTEVMFYSTVSNSWVGINGTYNPSNQTYTFTTDHFTPFAFVNPTNPDYLYISQSITNPQVNQKWYPQVGMGNPSSYGANDWTYLNDTARFYVIPAGSQGIFASKFQVTWDRSKANLTVTNGNLWGSNMIYQAIDSSSGNNGRYWFNITSNNLTNALPDTTGGKYLAILKFAITQPGYIPVSIIGTDFRYYHATGDSTSGVYVTTNPGAMVFYLGDFESPASQNIGDGKINATDISNFSTAYWSLNTNSLYRAKYDIGPTNINGSYWAMPTPDNKIEFEDLVIFSIGYGKTAAGQLLRIKSEEPVIVSTGTMTRGEDGLYRLPVNLNGPVYDVRAFSVGFNYNSSTLEYAGIEKQGELTGNTSFLIGKAEGSKIYMDGSLVGTPDGISTEGTTANILFSEKSAGNHDVSINSVILRNSYNEEIEAKFGLDAGSLIPKTFGLSQNYPNPFNPATTIKYQLPSTVKVTIRIYDIIGREVVTLVNGVQEAGYYSAEWNAQNYASGVYFYKMTAGDFENVKKLVLVK